MSEDPRDPKEFAQRMSNYADGITVFVVLQSVAIVAALANKDIAKRLIGAESNCVARSERGNGLLHRRCSVSCGGGRIIGVSGKQVPSWQVDKTRTVRPDASSLPARHSTPS